MKLLTKFGARCLAISMIILVSSGPEAPANTFTDTFTVSTTIGVGVSPLTAVITPNGAEVYVSDNGSNAVSVISTATDTVTSTVSVGSGPDALAVSPDGSKVYVGQSGGEVSIIDTATKTVSTISTGGPVHDLAITPDGAKVYLAMEFAGLKKITTSNNLVTTVSSILCPEGVAVTPDGQFLYVNYQCGGPGGTAGHDAIGKFDVATDSFIKSITGLPNVGTKIAVSPNGARVWATDADACINPFYDHKNCPVVPQGVVNVIATKTDELQRSMGVPGRVAFFPGNSFTVLGGAQLLILNKSMLPVGLIDIAASGSLAVTPDGKKAYAPVPNQNAVKLITVSE